MKILIKNLNKIYTDNNFYNDAYIVIEDNKIMETGTNFNIIKNNKSNMMKFDRIIDGKGKIALPGLVNTHTHSSMTLLRGYADDMPLKKWLEEKIWPYESQLTRRDIYWGTMLAVMEMLQTGTTTFADMYFEMDVVAEVVKNTGIRALLSEGLIESNDGQIGLNKSLDFCQKWNNSCEKRIKTMFGPHAPYTCSDDYLKSIINLSETNNIGIHIHLAETRKEYMNSLKKNNATPVQHLNDLGLFNEKTLAAHCVHITPEDIEILAKNNVSIAYNPSSNMKLGSGIAPVTDMLQADIKVAFGTDGVASNNNFDLFEEARIGSYLQKVNSENPVLLDTKTILKMLTVNGAESLGFSKLGKIETGYMADIILVNIEEKSFYYPHHNNLSNLFYAGNGRDVSTVIINGKIIYHQKEFLTIDKEKVFFEIENINSNK